MVKELDPEGRMFIALSGLPGSGKTTLCHQLDKELQANSASKRIKWISMDGYHCYRKDLSEEQMKRRGAPDTFDTEKYTRELRELKYRQRNTVPSFDHKLQDPIEDDVYVNDKVNVIIIEGIYTLSHEGLWKEASKLMDLNVYLNVPWDIAKHRLAKRHQDAFLLNVTEAIKRVKDNDQKNAHYVMNHCYPNADYLVS